MRTEEEVRQLREELIKTDFVAEYGTSEELHSPQVAAANWASDALQWVLGEWDTDTFKSEIELEVVDRIIADIEKRTGKKYADY